jgi:predicted lactoylglutathione lyase
MGTKIFVNLPVKDLNKSKEFFGALGFTFDPRFTDENAACVVISDDIYAMLLTEGFFARFTKRKIADATQVTEAIVALSAESRAKVDDLAGKAVAVGGKLHRDPEDHGWMYGQSFEDPDGHIWEVYYMDQTRIPG